MHWSIHILMHIAALYITVGVYPGQLWSRQSGFGFWQTLGFTSICTILWPAGWDTDARNELTRPRKTGETKQLRNERRRMALEEAKEEASVLLLEASVGHREKMAQLHDRRKKAEEMV